MNANDIITSCLMIGLLLITLSFVFYKKKVLLMLRALFSARVLQQLLREGKLANQAIFLYSTLLSLFAFPCLFFAFFYLFFPQVMAKFPYHLLLLFVIILGIVMITPLISVLFLRYFTAIFNYQEERYYYTTLKTLYRFYNALFLILIIPIAWYTRVAEIITFVYLPFFLIIFSLFFIRFLRNVSGVGRIHFFIYFCALEILPYLLAVKLLIINL